MQYNSSIGVGGIGYNPPAVSRQSPRTVTEQLFNRPAYQRNRVSTGQMAEMERANQDRYRAEVMPLQTGFNRSLNEANQRQTLASTDAANQMSQHFFGLANNYQNQQYGLDRQNFQQNLQFMWPLLSQFFNV